MVEQRGEVKVTGELCLLVGIIIGIPSMFLNQPPISVAQLGVRNMNVNTTHTHSKTFDARALASALPSEKIGGWTKEATLEYAACAWLNDHRFADGDMRHPLYPEAETIVCSDIVLVAELVSKHIGPELFGRALAEGLNLEKLVTAARQPRFNVQRFVERVKAGKHDRRYFGTAKVVHQPRRDQSGYTQREKLEMMAAYMLDDERFGNGGGGRVLLDDVVGETEADALWPSSEDLEAVGVDLVVLEQIRSTLGTDGLAKLVGKGVDLVRLTVRVRRGVNVRLLARAFDGGLPVALFNSNSFRTSEFQTEIVVHEGGGAFAGFDLTGGLYGHRVTSTMQ